MAQADLCNIGTKERRKRLILGLTSFAIAFWVRFVAAPGSVWFYPVILIALFFGFLGTLQALFCT